MAVRKTQLDFEIEVYNKYGNEYKILGTYKNNKTKVLTRHNVCGNEWEATPNNLLKGCGGCPKCCKNRSYSHEEYKAELHSKTNDFEIIGEYKDAKTPLKIKHLKCGREFEYAKPNVFLKRPTCRYCYKENRDGVRNKSFEDFVNKMDKSYFKTYEIVGEYVDRNTKIDVLHKTCGKIFKISPAKMLQGRGCSHCYNTNSRWNTSTFKQEINRITDGEYELIGDYISMKNSITIKHIKCGNVYEENPMHFLYSNKRCACETGSKGEREICRVLDVFNVSYKQQYVFLDCRSKNNCCLRFDFAILNKHDEVEQLIEFQGQQHYNPVQFGGMSVEEAEISYKESQERDEIKRQYCIDNGYDLIEIPYWEFDNIEKILKNRLYIKE